MGNGKGGVEGGEVDCCSGATRGGRGRNSHRRGRVECWGLAVEEAVSALVVLFGHGMRFGMRQRWRRV